MSSLLLLLFSILTFSCIAQSAVPSSKQFKYVFYGGFDGSLQEEGEFYYDIRDVLTTSPFALCHYTTQASLSDPVYVLALRLDTHLVWEVNRKNPVHLNSTLTFGSDGNLVLADPKGNIVWETATGNKDVVGLELFPNGNLVLLDKEGNLVWQSFDYPTDTLLVDQSLRARGPRELVSRRGRYTLAMEAASLDMHYKGDPYFSLETYNSFAGPLEEMRLTAGLTIYEPFLNDLSFNLTTSEKYNYVMEIATPVYNTTFSFLRIEDNGNLKAYSFVENISTWNSWEQPFTLFTSNGSDSECHMPEKCGRFGICQKSKCVACPSPSGLLPWSKKCSSPKLPLCSDGAAVTTNVRYYEIEGVDHFSSAYVYTGNDPITVDNCREKCTSDCKCKGFFYTKDDSKCLITHQLNTLTKVSNSTHVAFIKIGRASVASI
ncbi:hypothetical protein GIB67_005982 [Kingdonia uniflora]|uniref:Uncharacterized protein n=1 Tax=Kingdonia uniflora TaxID=39325 RepID=A0A7J7MC55_9MAGN|nr:hypothetical protein GIB67_005982 [Kingdonia uniflora]